MVLLVGVEQVESTVDSADKFEELNSHDRLANSLDFGSGCLSITSGPPLRLGLSVVALGTFPPGELVAVGD